MVEDTRSTEAHARCSRLEMAIGGSLYRIGPLPIG